MIISLSDSHLLNTFFPIIVTDEGIETWTKFLLSLKHQSPIDVTEEGIETCFNEGHKESEYSPIEVTEDGIII